MAGLGWGRAGCHALRVCPLAALIAVLLFSAAPASAAVTLPAGFDDQGVTIVSRPTAMDWTPDGRMVIVSHPGIIRIFENGVLQTPAALDWRPNTCRSEEWGMNGVAVDPNFATNNYIYVYYTAKKFGGCEKNVPNSPVNRVSRFVLQPNDVVDPLSETIIVDGIPDPDGIHAGGDVEFGSDGNLWISTGDGGCDFRGDSGCYPFNDAALDLGSTGGKILRVTKTGAIPPDNPYQGAGTTQCSPTGYTVITSICREIYSYGLRNPFRIALKGGPPTPQVYANDVGLNIWEEVNQVAAGANFGWNVREGNCVRDSSTDCGPPPAGMTNPIHSYNHATGCVSVTASDFVPTSAWPSPYDGDYLFGDLICEKIWQLDSNGGGVTEFATGVPWLIDGVFGPDGASKSYYYISWVGFPNDEIRKIVYTGQENRTPTADASANPTSGGLPLNVAFDGTASSDPNNDTLTYDWDFGDGSPHSTSPMPSHSYSTPDTFTVTLTVDDGNGAQDTDTVEISVGNEAPQVSIDAPVASEQFSVGETLTLVGSAEDSEDGTLPNSALEWRVERHHSTHSHPFLDTTMGNNIPIVGPEPEELSAATNSYLEIILTATDSFGVSTTVSRNIYPKTVPITFGTSPSGLQLEVAGSTLTTPITVTSWDNWDLIVNAPDQFNLSGQFWRFASWSDLGARSHTINTPSLATSYTATFAANQAPTAVASADPTSGGGPLTIDFDATGSSDPDDPSLTYSWDFDDGSPPSSSPTPTHTYNSEGTFSATLTVDDGHGAEDVDVVPITVTNTAPQVSIDAPLAGTLFKVGEAMTLTGTAQDAEEGTLPDSALDWRVIKHHGAHTHTHLPNTPGNNVPITGPAPEDLAATTSTHLEIVLEATDSLGVTTTVTRDIFPKTVGLTFATNPTGLDLTVAGQALIAPQTITSWQDWVIPVSAQSQFDDLDQFWHFSSWSDSGAGTHTITTPGTASTYTATFQANQAPTAVAAADDTSGPNPHTVNFDATDSSDPDDASLSYLWDFGDGSPTSTSPTPAHTYTTTGPSTATLTVDDGHGGVDTDTIQIEVTNGPPQPTIVTPATGTLFSVGQGLTLSGGATDAEDGTLGDGSLSWKVLVHHDTHTHTLLDDTPGNNVPITGPAPENLSATTNSHLELILTATDSNSATTTVTRNINPRTVALTFQSNPTGFQLGVAGTTFTAPQTITSWAGWQIPVSAPDQLDSQGRYHVFDTWSDGGAATHTITTPSSAQTYQASFRTFAYPRPGGGTPLRVALVPEYVQCATPNGSHVGPLDEPSCSPPQRASSQLTTSTQGRGNGFARLDVKPGTNPPSMDDADLRIRATVTDVVRNIGGAPDYVGPMILRMRLRITDGVSGPNEQTAATVQDIAFSVPVNCVATNGTPTPVGGTCSVDTMTDSILPNFAKERSRAVMSAFSMEVLDAGADSSITPTSAPFGLGCPPTCGSGDEAVYMRQGVFAP